MHAAAGVEECASGRRGERRLAADESGPAARDAAEDADVGKKKRRAKKRKTRRRRQRARVRTMTPYLARVSITLTRRQSLRKPTWPDVLARTAVKTMMSFSRP